MGLEAGVSTSLRILEFPKNQLKTKGRSKGVVPDQYALGNKGVGEILLVN